MAISPTGCTYAYPVQQLLVHRFGEALTPLTRSSGVSDHHGDGDAELVRGRETLSGEENSASEGINRSGRACSERNPGAGHSGSGRKPGAGRVPRRKHSVICFAAASLICIQSA